MNTSENYKDLPLSFKSVGVLLIKLIIITSSIFAVLSILNKTMSMYLGEERINGMVDHYDGQFQEIYTKKVNAQYIFIGSSHITHGVTPEVFEKSNKSFFNFALNGSHPSYYLWWYNNVFKANDYSQPNAIIVGVDWFMFDIDWLWREPVFDYKYLNKYPGKWYNIDEIVTYVTNKFPVFSSRNRFGELISSIPSGKRIKNNNPVRIDLFYKGYAPYEINYNGDFSGEIVNQYYSEEKNALTSLLDQFESDGITVIFVMAPEYLPGRYAPKFDEMTDIIAKLAVEKNIPFLNYNRELISEINYDYSRYSDWGHLNDKGAHQFSEMLYKDLNDLLEFNEHVGTADHSQ